MLGGAGRGGWCGGSDGLGLLISEFQGPEKVAASLEAGEEKPTSCRGAEPAWRGAQDLVGSWWNVGEGGLLWLWVPTSQLGPDGEQGGSEVGGFWEEP